MAIALVVHHDAGAPSLVWTEKEGVLKNSSLQQEGAAQDRWDPLALP